MVTEMMMVVTMVMIVVMNNDDDNDDDNDDNDDDDDNDNDDKNAVLLNLKTLNYEIMYSDTDSSIRYAKPIQPRKNSELNQICVVSREKSSQ